MEKTAYLIVNFGGPRSLEEVEEFLIALLCDQDVVRTSLPAFLHRLLFTRVAKKRTKKVAPDYALIGGKSPIFEDTEFLADCVRSLLPGPVLTFHRYLPKTHAASLRQIEDLKEYEKIRVLPLFPQFTYATTGSIARFFASHLTRTTLGKLSWISSYPTHPAYIQSFVQCIRNFLQDSALVEAETALLFSAHGLPQRFIDTGDPYERQCRQTYALLKDHFPKAICHLSYQSQFGKDPWIQPYTNKACEEVDTWAEGRRTIVIVPLSFVSDHIETLYEIEHIYLPILRSRNKHALRCPALNRNPDWVAAIVNLFQESERVPNSTLIRGDQRFFTGSHNFCRMASL